MKVIIPERLAAPQLTPSQIAALQAVQEAFTQVADAVAGGIPQPKTWLMRLIDGYKAYIVMFLTIAAAVLAMYLQVVTVPVGIASILTAMGFGAGRSAFEKQTTAIKVQTQVLKEQTAQIVNSVVNPTSPVAAQTAAAVAPPSDTVISVPLKFALAEEKSALPPPPPAQTIVVGGITYKAVKPRATAAK